jgi:hypothetical protein
VQDSAASNSYTLCGSQDSRSQSNAKGVVEARQEAENWWTGLRSDVAQGSILHKSKSWMYEDSGLGKEHSTNLSFGGLRAENKSRAPKWSEEERVQVLQNAPRGL